MAKTVYLIRLDGTYARITNIVADPVLVNMTGKGEPYRDLPNASGALVGPGITVPINSGLTVTNPVFTPSISDYGYRYPTLTGTLSPVNPDDVDHVAPRQGDQVYTFWKFTWATVADTPQFTYAEFRRGDIIADTAPNTDPAP